MIDILLWLFLAFLFPLLGVVAGAHYHRWLNDPKRPYDDMEDSHLQ